MQGLKAEFTQGDIDRRIDGFVQNKEQKAFERLSYIGINAVNFARQQGTYTDRTGNLRSSIGYAVIKNGVIGKEHYEGDAAEGREQSRKVVAEVSRRFNKGMVLILVAGMEYAAAVESRGYDVLTGSTREAERLMKALKSAMKATP
jgi:hypothetical protein